MNRSWVYIVSNASRTTLYIGVTNDLPRRMREHKSGIQEGFSKRYRCFDLLYFEEYADIRDAIAREKQLKGWRRCRKDALIDTLNPKRMDLSKDWQ
ncbi:MAG: GIY-YIG nuclease family protein [Alistipes sp.]|nr:GIY-YIG nuclease family protein [Alistipes sp.]